MLARDEIVAVLNRPGALPEGVDVIPYARGIAAPPRSTVMVRIDKVLPPKGVAGALWEVRGALVLVAAETAAGPGDDELEALLQDVLVALDTQEVANAITWTEANRSTYGRTPEDPTNPAYEVAVTTWTQKE